MLTPISVQEGIAAGHRQTHQQTHKIVGGGVVPRIHAAMDCGAKTMQNSKFEIFLIVDVLRYGSTVFGWYASRSQAQTVKVKVPMPPQTKGTHSPTLSSTQRGCKGCCETNNSDTTYISRCRTFCKFQAAAFAD